MKTVASSMVLLPMKTKKTMPGRVLHGLKNPWRISRWLTQNLYGSQWRSQVNPNQRSPGGLRVSCFQTQKTTSTLREERLTACTSLKPSLKMKESTCAKPSTAVAQLPAPAFLPLKVSRSTSQLTTCMLIPLMPPLTWNGFYASLRLVPLFLVTETVSLFLPVFLFPAEDYWCSLPLDLSQTIFSFVNVHFSR